MKYKINHWKCFWSTYHDTILAFIDKIENETIGRILMYIILYPSVILGFPIFLTIAFIWYRKRVKRIKRALPADEIAIRSMIKQGYVKAFDKDQIHIIEEKQTIKKQNEKVWQDERSKKLFKYGDILYTVQGKSQVIKFYVDKISFNVFKCSGGGKIGIREYWCNCYKHHLPYSNNFGSWRCRHNHNLFKTEQEAYAYLSELRQGDK